MHISSVHGLRASQYKSAYVAAKHGLEGLSKVIALEGGPRGVTSNTICPAYVRTPLVEKQIDDQARAHGIPADRVVSDIMLSEPAIKRLIEPAEVAELVAFLAVSGRPSPTARPGSSTAAGPPAKPGPTGPSRHTGLQCGLALAGAPRPHDRRWFSALSAVNRRRSWDLAVPPGRPARVPVP